MRFSKRRYSPLGFLAKDGRLLSIHIDEGDKTEVDGLQNWFVPKMREFMPTIDRGNIIRPSEAFVDAALQAGTKNFLPNMVEFSGLLNGISGAILQSQITIFYSIKQADKGSLFINFIIFANTTNTIVGFSLPDKNSKKQQIWFSSLFDKPKEGEFIAKEELTNIQAQYLRVVHNITSLLLFKRYAKVETKEFGAGEKTKYLGEKYINDTNFTITYLDSHWFTNIIKSAGFGVRGHFRLQPCGVGMKDRRLIWIESFEKTGYTAPARKLKQESE